MFLSGTIAGRFFGLFLGEIREGFWEPQSGGPSEVEELPFKYGTCDYHDDCDLLYNKEES